MANPKKKKFINVAVAGCGDLAKAFYYYLKTNPDSRHHPYPSLCGYDIDQIKFVCGFDIDKRKSRIMMKDLWEDLPSLETNGAETNMIFQPPVLNDFPSKMIGNEIHPETKDGCDVVEVLKRWKVDILVNMITPGCKQSSEMYAYWAAEAGVHFINCTQAPICTDQIIRANFRRKNLCLAGDGIKSPMDGRFLRQIIQEEFQRQGVKILTSHEIELSSSDYAKALQDPEREIQYARGAQTQLLKSMNDRLASMGILHTEVHNCQESHLTFHGTYGGYKFELKTVMKTTPSVMMIPSLVTAIRIMMYEAQNGRNGLLRILSSSFFNLSSDHTLSENLTSFQHVYANSLQ